MVLGSWHYDPADNACPGVCCYFYLCGCCRRIEIVIERNGDIWTMTTYGANLFGSPEIMQFQLDKPFERQFAGNEKVYTIKTTMSYANNELIQVDRWLTGRVTTRKLRVNSENQLEIDVSGFDMANGKVIYRRA